MHSGTIWMGWAALAVAFLVLYLIIKFSPESFWLWPFGYIALTLGENDGPVRPVWAHLGKDRA